MGKKQAAPASQAMMGDARPQSGMFFVLLLLATEQTSKLSA